jgi:hypothetical protein
MKRLAQVALFALLVHCYDGELDELCADLVGSCRGTSGFVTRDDCIDDATEMKSAAEAAHCGDAFEAHFQCVDQARCEWRESCRTSQEWVAHCISKRTP